MSEDAYGRTGARPHAVELPPGQRRIEGFPRFGTHGHRPPPEIPDDPVITITGAVRQPFEFRLSDLVSLPRRQVTADFHCVSGWSAIGLVWEGVGFEAFYRAIIEPSIPRAAAVTHAVFEGLDGYRSFVLLEDAMAEDVVIAEHLNGDPLDGDHGAPARLVSPSQYGFMSTKHLCRIELHTSEPKAKYHRAPLIHIGLQMVKPHRRASVWHEERHRYLPGWLVRPVYRQLVQPIKSWSAVGSVRSRAVPPARGRASARLAGRERPPDRP